MLSLGQEFTSGSAGQLGIKESSEVGVRRQLRPQSFQGNCLHVSQAGIGQSRSLHEGLALQLLSALLWYQVTSHRTTMPFVSWSQKTHAVISSILKFRKQRQWEAKDMNTKRSSSFCSYSSIFLGSMLRSQCLHEVQIPMRITWCSSANGS